jgi:hypothetical protein
MEDVIRGHTIKGKFLNLTLLSIKNPAIKGISEISIFFFEKDTKYGKLLIVRFMDNM